MIHNLTKIANILVFLIFSNRKTKVIPIQRELLPLTFSPGKIQPEYLRVSVLTGYRMNL
jgi:hypothetical protein